MCKYCENGEILIKKEILEGCYIGWSEELQAFDEIYKVIIKGDSLCLGREDEQCIEAFETVKINYCPVCGRKLKEGD